MSPPPPAVPADGAALAAERTRLRLRSLSWALLAALAAGGLALAGSASQALALGFSVHGLESGLRAAGCGFFYGLLAFHLQRVDPDDAHLQAGLVGAVCGLRSLALPLPPSHLGSFALGDLLSVMMGWLDVWLPLWLPLIGSAVLLQVVQRVVPSLRP